MHRQKSFPLRIAEQERQRARRLARTLGTSENRLYADLIHEGLLVREQMGYFEKLRMMSVPASRGLALLEMAPDVPPNPEDALPKAKRNRTK